VNKIEKAKEVLEIASLSTFIELNRESLGNGILEIKESSATSVFNRQITELTAADVTLQSMRDAIVAIDLDDGLVRIDSKATILSSFDQLVQVEHSLEFVIDPIMEGS